MYYEAAISEERVYKCLFYPCQVPAYAIVLFKTTFLMVLCPTYCVLSLGKVHEYLGGVIP